MTSTPTDTGSRLAPVADIDEAPHAPLMPYTITTRGERLWAECVCRALSSHSDTAQGRSNLGRWKSRHQMCEKAGKAT